LGFTGVVEVTFRLSESLRGREARRLGVMVISVFAHIYSLP
jgi:hypothetical protein